METAVPNFDDKGLVTAIIQDNRSSKVLMVAHMNQRAWELTLETKLATFWSRSRQQIWVKGETSGHTMKVCSVELDCDADAVLLHVDPAGPACHTGSESCFTKHFPSQTQEELDVDMRISFADQQLASFRALCEVVEQLRAPGGCEWDRAQTHRSLQPHLLEETYEVLDAIDNNLATLDEELGDLLIQICMHSVIAQEREDGFNIGDVAGKARAKLVSRHPHIFSDSAEVVSWEKLKSKEKPERSSVLEGVPKTLPALALAFNLQKRAARVGFEKNVGAARITSLILETLSQLTALTEGSTLDMEAVIGDILFLVVKMCRVLKINPEDVLRRQASNFANRFTQVEQTARAQGLDLYSFDETEWQKQWKAVISRNHH